MRQAYLSSAIVLALFVTACNDNVEDGAIAEGESANEVAVTPAGDTDRGLVPDTQPAVDGTEAMAATPQVFVDKAAASDEFEIQSSRLALEKSEDESIREFAQRLIDDHTEASANLREAASGVTPALTVQPELNPKQKSDLQDLQDSDTAGFNQRYLTIQIAAHETALAMLRNYADSGAASPLTEHAKKTAPVVQHHLETVRGMKPGE